MSGNITFISAGAGSGKTHRLTQLLHQELKNGVDPAGTIATTFTRKAAAELRERVRGYLLQENEARLANAIGQARIGTVNSVCGELLQRFAFEAGLSPSLRVMEEAQSALLYQQAIEAAMTDAHIEEIHSLAYRLGIESWVEDVKAIANLARANAIDPDALPGFAQENADALLALFPGAGNADIEQQVTKEIQRLIPIVQTAAEDNPTQKNIQGMLESLQDFQQKLSRGRPVWSEWAKMAKTNPPAKLRDAAEDFQRVMTGYESHPQLHQDIRRYIEAIFGIAGRALAEFDERKRRLGAIDFIDQERKLLDVLDLPAVRQALADEIELLLVDEFQDTSPIQLALFARLARLAKRTYWVGDTKQAIYGFRGSDARLMEAILNHLEASGNQPDTLEYSWRSRPDLVGFANKLFVPAFADTLRSERVELKPKRKNYSEAAAIQAWALQTSNKGEQAQALASGIRALIASGYQICEKDTNQVRPVTFSDIAVLARMNDSVLAIAQALTAAGIPTETAQPGLLAKPEAVLAIACLRRLADPEDTLATAEIVSLTSGEAPEVWLENRLAFVASRDKKGWGQWLEAGADANPIIQRLAALRPQCQVLSVKEALELVVAECHADANVLSWSFSHEKGRMRLANLQALIGMAESYEESCRGSGNVASIPGFVLWLKEQARAGQDGLAEAGTNSVRVLTYHGCKGLEWPVTICTELTSNIRDHLWGASVQPRGGIDVENPLKDRFIRFWPWPFGKQQKVPLSDRADQTADAAKFHKEATEEAKRLLYVGLTRARDLLVMAGQADKSGNLASGEWIESLDCPQLFEAVGDALEFQDGTSIRRDFVEVHPESVEQALASDSGQPLQWFARNPTIPRLPMVANPSAAMPVPCRVADVVTIGPPLQTQGQFNAAGLGTALHACIAATVCDRANLSGEVVSRLLESNGVGGAVEADAVIAQIREFLAWCEKRHGEAPMLAEHPIEMVLENGQWVAGQIDLLIDSPDGWVLVDHKASMWDEDDLSYLTTSYSGQLAMYWSAIQSATGRGVKEQWLHLPLKNKAVRVELS